MEVLLPGFGAAFNSVGRNRRTDLQPIATFPELDDPDQVLASAGRFQLLHFVLSWQSSESVFA